MKIKIKISIIIILVMEDIIMNDYYIKSKNINFDIINYLIKCDNIEFIYKHKENIMDTGRPSNKNYILERETKRDFYIKNIFINSYNFIETNAINDIIYYYKLKYISETYDFSIKLDNLNSIKNFFTTPLEYDEQIIIQDYLDNIKLPLIDKPFEYLIKSDRFDLCFVMRSNYFLLLPDIKSTITPNDLYIYNSFNENNTYLTNPYTPFCLTCYYIEDIDNIKINSLRHLGEIMKTRENKKEWIKKLENLKITIFEYFRINFKIIDTGKIFISIIYPESILDTLKFYAIYYGDFVSGMDTVYYELNVYYIDDIINNIILSLEYMELTGKEINILYDIDYYYYKKNISKKWKKEKNPLIFNKQHYQKNITKKNHIGGSIPLKINLNVYENRIHKKKLKDYLWYYIGNKIDINTLEENGFIYGYKEDINKKKRYYKLQIKSSKPEIHNINDYYNLFSHYYVGYFEYELYLTEEQHEKTFVNYIKLNKIEYKLLLNTINEKRFKKKIISHYLYNGIILESIKEGQNSKGIMKNNIYFPQFQNNNSLNLLSLVLINDRSNLNISELIYRCDEKLNNTSTNLNDSSNKYVSKIIFILDNISNYKFELIPTLGFTFNNSSDFNNYFKINFSSPNLNIIEYVGWLLFNEEFQFKMDIRDLKDSDLNYIKNLYKDIVKCFINYYTINLNIDINEENIIILCHNYVYIPGMHFRILIVKDINKYLFGKTITYDIKIRYFYIRNIINLLELNIDFFNKFNYNIFINLNKYSEIIHNKMIGGISKKNKIENWINKYINKNNNIKLYILNDIKINFLIEEKLKKNVYNDILNKWMNYKYIMKGTIGSIFRNKLFLLFNIISKNITIKNICILLNRNIQTEKKLYIGEYDQKYIELDSFYISDNNKLSDFDIKYSNMVFDIIYIHNNLKKIEKIDVICDFMSKILISLLWSLSHIDDKGIIIFTIRETLSIINSDLIILLSNFCKIFIYIDYTIYDPTALPIKIVLTEIKNKILLIKYLEKILTFKCVSNLSFIKIENISNIDYDKQIKNITEPTIFSFNRMFEYMDSYKIDKYKTNYPKISKENEELYLIKSLILFLIQYLFIENTNEQDYYSLFEIIKKTNTKKILQIGLNNGHWTIFILTFLKFINNETNEVYKLISIDPYQDSIYKNIGIDNIKELNMFNSLVLINDFSYIYMEKKIKEKKNYDIIFINEYNIYDYTSIDIYNSFKLLNINGYLIIEGILNQKMNKILISIEKNYKNLEKINMSIKNIAIYNKIK